MRPLSKASGARAKNAADSDIAVVIIDAPDARSANGLPNEGAGVAAGFDEAGAADAP